MAKHFTFAVKEGRRAELLTALKELGYPVVTAPWDGYENLPHVVLTYPASDAARMQPLHDAGFFSHEVING